LVYHLNVDDSNSFATFLLFPIRFGYVQGDAGGSSARLDVELGASYDYRYLLDNAFSISIAFDQKLLSDGDWTTTNLDKGLPLIIALANATDFQLGSTGGLWVNQIALDRLRFVSAASGVFFNF